MTEGLVGEDLADGGGIQAGPSAELVYGDELVVLLVEAAPDDVHDLAAMALTAASNELNVLRVNAEPGEFRCHIADCCPTNLGYHCLCFSIVFR